MGASSFAIDKVFTLTNIHFIRFAISFSQESFWYLWDDFEASLEELAWAVFKHLLDLLYVIMCEFLCHLLLHICKALFGTVQINYLFPQLLGECLSVFGDLHPNPIDFGYDLLPNLLNPVHLGPVDPIHNLPNRFYLVEHLVLKTHNLRHEIPKGVDLVAHHMVTLHHIDQLQQLVGLPLHQLDLLGRALLELDLVDVHGLRLDDFEVRALPGAVEAAQTDVKVREGAVVLVRDVVPAQAEVALRQLLVAHKAFHRI